MRIDLRAGADERVLQRHASRRPSRPSASRHRPATARTTMRRSPLSALPSDPRAGRRRFAHDAPRRHEHVADAYGAHGKPRLRGLGAPARTPTPTTLGKPFAEGVPGKAFRSTQRRHQDRRRVRPARRLDSA